MGNQQANETWTLEDEEELRLLVVKLTYRFPTFATYKDQERADQLTRRKWRCQKTDNVQPEPHTEHAKPPQT